MKSRGRCGEERGKGTRRCEETTARGSTLEAANSLRLTKQEASSVASPSSSRSSMCPSTSCTSNFATCEEGAREGVRVEARESGIKMGMAGVVRSRQSGSC
jgi:hypothetical protein